MAWPLTSKLYILCRACIPGHVSSVALYHIRCIKLGTALYNSREAVNNADSRGGPGIAPAAAAHGRRDGGPHTYTQRATKNETTYIFIFTPGISLSGLSPCVHVSCSHIAHSAKWQWQNSVAPMESFELWLKRPCSAWNGGESAHRFMSTVFKMVIDFFSVVYIWPTYTDSHLKAIASLFTSYYVNKWENVYKCPSLFDSLLGTYDISYDLHLYTWIVYVWICAAVARPENMLSLGTSVGNRSAICQKRKHRNRTFCRLSPELQSDCYRLAWRWSGVGERARSISWHEFQLFWNSILFNKNTKINMVQTMRSLLFLPLPPIIDSMKFDAIEKCFLFCDDGRFWYYYNKKIEKKNNFYGKLRVLQLQRTEIVVFFQFSVKTRK